MHLEKVFEWSYNWVKGFTICAKIFEDVFIEEQVKKKFNPEILRQLTGDDKIDFDKFRKYCYGASNDYIMNHDGYDLYYKIMECYYRWKGEGRK